MASNNLWRWHSIRCQARQTSVAALLTFEDLFIATPHLTHMIRAVSRERGGPILDVLYQQLLRQGVKYFLPSSQLETVGRVREFTPEIVFHPTSSPRLTF